MNILFAAGDVGGARAILPVARLAKTQGHHVYALAHGTMQTEGDAEWQWLDINEATHAASTHDIVIYATSVADTIAVEIALAAQSSGKPCLHVLDNWSSYSERIQLVIPDAYTVMDSQALAEAKAAGISVHILHITGQPDLGKLAAEQSRWPGPGNTQSLLFVSEPAALDGGIGKRGYDEALVTDRLISALDALGTSGIRLNVVPHPRENRHTVEHRIRALCANLDNTLNWTLVPPEGVRAALHAASHVIGMSSILLYEAWLLGRPTLSLQPGLFSGMLQALSHRQGLIFHNRVEGVENAIKKWLSQAPGENSQDLSLHLNAAQSVLTLAQTLVHENRHPNADSADNRDVAQRGSARSFQF